MSNLQNYLAAVRRKIAAHGWVIQLVSESRTHPQFHYTLGLFPIAGFEIVIFGMTTNDGGIVLNDLAERVQHGTRFTNGQALTDVLAGGYAVTMLEISDANAWLKIARLLYTSDGTPLPSWQMVLPDAAHALPWDPAYSGPAQPLLGPPPQ